ncbi:MAG TPA: ABC transporter transmembrane domain-containing protein, partial [Patescibacteria group bacterium]|nr:ABC transporter transmembrane domain-containing protein [Patescibacteria group bacterium]
LTLLAAVVVILAAATYMRMRLVYLVAERVIRDLRAKIYRHLLTLDPAFFEQNKTGDQISRINADTSILQIVITTNLPMAFRHSLMLTGGLVMLCIVSPSMTGVVLLAVPVVLGPLLWFGRRVRAKSRDTQTRVGDVGSYSLETLQGIQTIQAFGYEDAAAAQFTQLADSVYKTALRYINTRAILIAWVISTVFGAIGLVLWYGGHKVLTGEMSAGELSAFIFYVAIVAGAVTAVSESLSDFNRAAGAADRIAGVLEAVPTVNAPRQAKMLPEKIAGSISFDNVSFSYPTRPNMDALHGVTFTVAPGDVVALVGPSGAGKTTTFQLLQRFYDPREGSIEIDGVRLADCDPRDIRRHLSVVSQDPAVFSLSIADNIRVGKPSATDAEVRRAAELAQADEFIAKLPQGYNTLVGERGNRLSGGQKQRIAIARAILKDSKILLLDEATSALDSANEVAVHAALRTLMEGRTTLIIAHRLSTVQNAANIIVMDQGHIVAQGTHAQLYQHEGVYQHLAALQLDLKAS